jgi:hypothetical protein
MFRGKRDSRCRKVWGLLSEYIDSSLSSENKSFVERHLQKCEGCSKELESLRVTVQLLRRVAEVPVPRSFTVTVPKPQRESAFGPAGLRWLRPATAIVAIALVALLAGDFSHAFVNNAGGNVTYTQLVPSTPTEQQTMVAIPGVIGKMSLATAKAAGYTNYTVLPPTPPPLDESHTMVSVPGVMGQMSLATAKAMGYTDYSVLSSSPPSPPVNQPVPSVIRNEEPTGSEVIVEGESGIGWPLRQTEIGLGATVFIMFALIIVSRRQHKAKVTVR